jgi:light-regulated signal transduction histidine kinase (bacteriophytochrome)
VSSQGLLNTTLNGLTLTSEEATSKEGMLHPPYVPTAEQRLESTFQVSFPLKSLQHIRAKGKGRHRGKDKAAAAASVKAESTKSSSGSKVTSVEMAQILSQVKEQLASQRTLDSFLKTIVGILKDITTFSRAAIYQFDPDWNGQVVAELVDDSVTSDFFQGLHFPSSDIPEQARELYKVNRLRILFDRDAKPARMVVREGQDGRLVQMTHSFLRAMSPRHSLYLTNMGVRSSMSISIMAFGRLWGLVVLHWYGENGKRLSFPERQLCLHIGETITENIEKLVQAGRDSLSDFVALLLSQENAAQYLLDNADRVLGLFGASYGVIRIGREMRLLNETDWPEECSEALRYLSDETWTSNVIANDAYSSLPGLLLGSRSEMTQRALIVSLSTSGKDYMAVFRKRSIVERHWAGDPRKERGMEPRNDFRSKTDTYAKESAEWETDKREAALMLQLSFCEGVVEGRKIEGLSTIDADFTDGWIEDQSRLSEMRINLAKSSAKGKTLITTQLRQQ